MCIFLFNNMNELTLINLKYTVDKKQFIYIYNITLISNFIMPNLHTYILRSSCICIHSSWLLKSSMWDLRILD